MSETDLRVRLGELPDPADYFPIETGRYEVQAGLKILGQQPIQGRVETRFFQIDRDYFAYLKTKRASRTESLSKYYRTHDLDPGLARSTAIWMMDRLCGEYPTYFDQSALSDDLLVFTNRLLGIAATVDLQRLRVHSVAHEPSRFPEGSVYQGLDFEGADALDFLASNIQEDVALTSMDPSTRKDWVSFLHLCFPNHWSPADKVGQPFLNVHTPVADFEKVARTSDKLLDAMIHRGPFVRFAWGIATDTELNHHPDNPPGRKLEREDAAYAGANTFMRIERQTLKGFPAHHASLFTIRTYFKPVHEVAADPARREQLREALATMTPTAQAYKGLARVRLPLIAYLS